VGGAFDGRDGLGTDECDLVTYTMEMDQVVSTLLIHFSYWRPTSGEVRASRCPQGVYLIVTRLLVWQVLAAHELQRAPSISNSTEEDDIESSVGDQKHFSGFGQVHGILEIAELRTIWDAFQCPYC
jgi:hypothetical protein